MLYFVVYLQETQAEIAVDQVFSRDLGSKTPKKSAAADQKKKEYGDWITVECYNHILFMQVSALINLGASPKLKVSVHDVVLKVLIPSK